MYTVCFVDGVSLGPGRCKVIAKFLVDERPEDEDTPANNAVLDWSRDREVTGLSVDFPIVRIALGPTPERDAFVAGRLGTIGWIRNEKLIEEVIHGPESYGFLRDLRTIGKHLYAAGMGRQVYCRVRNGAWVRFDEGLLNNPTDYLDVTGVNAIDGLNEGDIYAVGFNGEIWHRSENQWSPVDSPTNLILERVRAIDTDRIYACGQAGVLLRGHGQTWEIVEQVETEDDFWGLEWFLGKLYLATTNQLYRLKSNDTLEPIEQGLSGARTYSQLHAGHGALWSFGLHHLSWTEDGETWNEAVMQ